MPRLPDLVRDSRLDTEFHHEYIVHSYRTSDTATYKRSKLEKVLWRQERRIGLGGFGHIYLQKSTGSNGEVPQRRAVKRIRQATHRDYIHELEAIAKFSNPRYEHCFVKSYGWYEQGNSLCIAMEYLSLGDLHQCVSGHSPLLEKDVQTITSQILEGLQFMHDNEFAHRDIKPQNLLVRSKPPESWWVKIADFGISKRVDVTSNVSTTIKGSLAFMAPETFNSTAEGEAVISRDPYAADIWSVGCVTYYLFTKGTPFRDNIVLLLDYYRGSTSCPILSLPDNEISETSQDFVSALLKANPKERPTARDARMHMWLLHLIPDDLIMSEMKVKHQESSSTLDDRSSINSEADIPHDSDYDTDGRKSESKSSLEASARWTTQYPVVDRPLSPTKSSKEPLQPFVPGSTRIETGNTQDVTQYKPNALTDTTSSEEDSTRQASACATNLDDGTAQPPVEDSFIESSMPNTHDIQQRESQREKSPKVKPGLQARLDKSGHPMASGLRKTSFKVLARWAWIGRNDGELSFPKGAVFEAEDVCSNWYFGRLINPHGQRKSGIFPSSYVRPLAQDLLDSSMFNQGSNEKASEMGRVAFKYGYDDDHEYRQVFETGSVDKEEHSSNKADDDIDWPRTTTPNNIEQSYSAPNAANSAYHREPVLQSESDPELESMSCLPLRKLSSPNPNGSQPEYHSWRHSNQSQTLINECISESVYDEEGSRVGRSSAMRRNSPTFNISRVENDEQGPVQASERFEPLSMEKLAILNRSTRDRTYPSEANIRSSSSIQAVHGYGAIRLSVSTASWPERHEDDGDDDDNDNATDSTEEPMDTSRQLPSFDDSDPIKPSDSASGVGKSSNKRERTTYQEQPDWLHSTEELHGARKQSMPYVTTKGVSEGRENMRVPEKDISMTPREMIRRQKERLKEKGKDVSPKEMMFRRKGIPMC